jgi:hypothetical protein
MALLCNQVGRMRFTSIVLPSLYADSVRVWLVASVTRSQPHPLTGHLGKVSSIIGILPAAPVEAAAHSQQIV